MEGDGVLAQDFHPLGADELAVGEKQAEGRRRDMRQIALDQGEAHGGVGPAATLDDAPHEGHPDAAGHDGEHEIVHLGLADLPVGPIKGEQPRSVQAQKPDQKRQRPILVQADMLEEALEPTIGRGGLHRSRPLAGEVAEVHTAGADHGNDDQAERLQTALAQVNLGAQNSHEGGYGLV